MAVEQRRPATLDTGALFALEKVITRRGGGETARTLLRNMREHKLPTSVSTVVVAEWWRGQQGPAATLLAGMRVEAPVLAVAQEVGRLLAQVSRPQPSELLVVDAIVVVSASLRGDDIYTSDPDDITALRDAYVAMRGLTKDAVRVREV